VISDAVLVVAVGVFGVLVGSFLNVVVWRVPRGESVVSPASACPHCGHRIRSRDNIPVLSWLVLRGRCRDCGEAIAWRYPAVELVTGLLFAGVAAATGLSWSLPALLYLVGISVALTLIDLDHRRLPDAIVLPSYPVALALLALATWAPGSSATGGDLVRALIGGAAMFGVYFLLVLVYPRGMGFGDVKLAGVLGLYLGWAGWSQLVVGWFAAFLLGGVFALVLLATGRAGRKSAVPFGPWMLLGAGVGLLGGADIGSWYLGFLLA
jgi:leader peptidase (prepilin peptidase)/N-methyltransferase